MPSSIKIRIQKIIPVFLTLIFFHLNADCQVQELLPEINLNAGLQSNAVRVVRLDGESRIWIGTDNGLNIFNSTLPAQKNIITTIGNQSVWDIAFLDSLVLIGTRYDGLYIFNQKTGNLFQHLPSSAINIIRKIKILDKNCFILTNKQTYQWSDKILKILPVKTNLNVDFITDIFSWNGHLYGTTFPEGYILEFNRNTFEKDCTGNFFPPGRKSTALLCAMSSGNTLVLGGDRFYIIIEGEKIPKEYLIPQIKMSNYAVWDIAFIKNKIYLAIGETLTNQKGFIYEHGQTSFKENKISEKGFLTSFAFDSAKDCLYYGSLTKGLYLQKSISGNIFINTTVSTKFIANNHQVFGYDENSIINFSEKAADRQKKFYRTNNEAGGLITNVTLFGDTLVVAFEFSIQFYNLKTNELIYHLPIGADEIVAQKNDFYLFSNYRGVHKFKFNTYKIGQVKNTESFLSYPQKFHDLIIFLNREKGFNIIKKDSAFTLKCDDKTIAFTSDYAVIKDTLYALIRNSIKSYKIDMNSQKLILQKVSNLDNIVEGFLTEWIIAKNEKLYLVNDKGILSFNSFDNKIMSYYYFGNYNEINKPLIDGDSLLIATPSVLTKIAFTDIDNEEIPVTKNFTIQSPKNVNENLAFKTEFEYPDYLIQNHSLKEINLYRDGEFVLQKYTLGNEINFPAGLKYGSYEFHLNVGNTEIVKSLDITLPINRNPKFFIAVIIVVLAILSLLIKNWFDKKEFTKKLSQSRLLVLKQNLNPHFVFNSMNLISSLILEGKNKEAVKVVSEFSNLQRTYLETNNKEAITLTEELKFLESYLKLQQRRFYHDNEFQFSISIDTLVDTNSILLPPLILQPLAENAIKYGVIGSKAKEKKIWIDIKGRDPLIISIEDNGLQVTSKNKGFGLGHQIVEERISLFKSPISFFKNKSPLQSTCGYRVEICVGRGVK